MIIIAAILVQVRAVEEMYQCSNHNNDRKPNEEMSKSMDISIRKRTLI